MRRWRGGRGTRQVSEVNAASAQTSKSHQCLIQNIVLFLLVKNVCAVPKWHVACGARVVHAAAATFYLWPNSTINNSFALPARIEPFLPFLISNIWLAWITWQITLAPHPLLHHTLIHTTGAQHPFGSSSICTFSSFFETYLRLCQIEFRLSH